VWVASNRGTTQFSWGSELPEVPLETLAREPDAFDDATPTQPPIHDLILGRAEWTETSRPSVQLAPAELNQPGSFFPGSIEERMVYGAFPSLLQVDFGEANCPNAFQLGMFEQGTRSIDNTGFRCLRRFRE
jgi:hypothetical protein